MEPQELPHRKEHPKNALRLRMFFTRSKSPSARDEIAETNERGAAFVEGSVCFTILFLLFLWFADIVHLLLLQGLLRLGAEQGLAVAERLEALNLDVENLNLDNPADRQAYARFREARTRVLDTALALPRGTLFSDSANSNAVVRLAEVRMQDSVRQGVAGADIASAALIRPGEWAEFRLDRTVHRVDHPTLCPAGILGIGRGRLRAPSDRSGGPVPRSAGPQSCEPRRAAGTAGERTYNLLLRDHPFMVRLCASKTNFFPIFRRTVEFCETALGYRSELSTASLQPKGSSPNPSIRLDDEESCPFLKPGARCGAEADGYRPPGSELTGIGACLEPFRQGHCVEGMSDSNFPTDERFGISAAGPPCCSGKFRKVPIGNPGDRCYGHIFRYVCE